MRAIWSSIGGVVLAAGIVVSGIVSPPTADTASCPRIRSQPRKASAQLSGVRKGSDIASLRLSGCTLRSSQQARRRSTLRYIRFGPCSVIIAETASPSGCWPVDAWSSCRTGRSVPPSACTRCPERGRDA